MAIGISYNTPEGTPAIAETWETWEETVSGIDDLRRVLCEAYVQELAHNMELVSEETLTDWYDPRNNESRNAFIEATKDIHDRGSRITVVRGVGGEVVGFAKAGPAPHLTRNAAGGYDYEGYYLNNIAVRPEAGLQEGWGKGLGSMLLHANFLAQEYDTNLPLVLDAINGNNRVNAWYQRLGMVPDPGVPTGSIRFGETHIPETYYVTPDNVLLGGFITRLVARQPWLHTATKIS